MKRLLIVLINLIMLHTQGFSQSLEKDHMLSRAKANEEIQIVTTNILRYHPEPFHVTDREYFFSVIEEITNREGPISIGQHYFDLCRISSLVYDTHTQVHPTEDTPGLDYTFPLRFRVFGDQLYIIAGSEAYREAIGKKVVSINNRDSRSILDSLAHYSAADNNPRRKAFAEMFLYMPEAYKVLGLVKREDPVSLELEDFYGRKSQIMLNEKWEKGLANFSNDAHNPFLPKELITVHDVMGTKVPFYLENIDLDYWWSFLDEEKKYQYIQINKQYGEMATQSSPEFHMEWMSAFWSSEVEVVIIDLRNNPGGTIPLTATIPGFLSYAQYIHPTLRGIAILIGPYTVSAGTILAAQLEYDVLPVIIGGPSGSSSNMYLSAYKTNLPHSRIDFEVSMIKKISKNAFDSRPYIAPDYPIEMSFADYVNGKDPLIDFAKKINQKMRDDAYHDAATIRDIWKRSSQPIKKAKD